MASIVARKRQDGTTIYTAQIRIKKDGRIVHSEAKSFSKRATAKAWATAREDQLRLDPTAGKPRAAVTVGDLIAGYLRDRGAIDPLGRTKAAHLRLLQTFDIAGEDAASLTPARLIAHVRDRRLAGAGPSTVGNDLIWLRVVLRYAKALGEPVSTHVLDDASEICRQERLIAKSRKRKRRPTGDEMKRIDSWFRGQFERSRRNPGPPMHLIMWAAIYSCRRLDELCSMRLSDFNREHRTWLVRDLKHPDGSKGHDREMLVTDKFLSVVDAILSLPGRDPSEDRLLPYNSRSIGAYWQRQMKLLGIEDLHFHDLRRHGCSLLAEEGK